MKESEGPPSSNEPNIIRELRDKGFDSSDERLAVALGRPADDIAAMANGSEQPDEDAVIKARGIAEQRGIDLSDAALHEPVREHSI
jgi:hypothetical protein